MNVRASVLLTTPRFRAAMAAVALALCLPEPGAALKGHAREAPGPRVSALTTDNWQLRTRGNPEQSERIPSPTPMSAQSVPIVAGAREAIVYTLRFPAPHTHYVEVEARVPADGRADIELMMPVWTPGSYLVREFARHVERLAATTPQGAALPVVRTRKNRWRITTGGAPVVVVQYGVYCREMSVRTNWVDAGFALLNGAPTFITIAGDHARPHEIKVDLPPSWQRTVSPLDPAGASPHHYVAPDYDTLVDSPLLVGNPAIHEFEEAGVRHVLASEAEGGVWDGPRSARDVQAIVRANLRLWGSLPYPRYVFFNMLTEAGGGLEHANSTVMMSHRWRTGTRRDYLGWLGLVSHEYFHAWNVKRLRPLELGPFDYENEVHTTSLWVAEGFTDYYDGLLVLRAGLSRREDYLEQLGNGIRELQTTPGRLAVSLSSASWDAWIKQYRPDENTPNTNVNYYTKGGIVAFLLDAHVRRLTGGARSLDDVMRLAYARYSGARGYTQDQFRQTASEVAGADLEAFFGSAVDSTDELSYGEALDWYGLQFRTVEARADKGWIGAATKNDAGRLVVTQVRRGTPAHEAGLNVDDEIVAIGDYRVRPEQLEARLEQYRPGQVVSLLIARREQLLRIEVTLGTEPPRGWALEVRPDATPEQQAHLAAWLWE
jgi:predicted metalloprotease with PDZ domain